MLPAPVRTTFVTLLLLAATPVVACAQIYVWRDASGTMVLSDRPKDPSARTFAVDGTAALRATRPAKQQRMRPFDPLIDEHATLNGVSPDLVRAVIQAESAFNPRARSVKGAMGLMQLMPATAAQYGVVDPYDPRENIRAGVAYLASLLSRYAGNVELALAAYNAGPAAVQKYGSVPPYRETRNYVNKIRQATPAPAPSIPAPSRQIFRTVENVNGRIVTKYSNVPSAGAEVVTLAARR
jgi:soluble lytic murein transglycosylase-like protein